MLLKSPENAPTLKDLETMKSIIIEPSFNGQAIRSLADGHKHFGLKKSTGCKIWASNSFLSSTNNSNHCKQTVNKMFVV